MSNVSSYCGLVDAKIRASDKDLPVTNDLFMNSIRPQNKYLEVNWGLITMLLKLLEFTDSCVVFEAAVAPPIGVEPVVYLTEAHFSRLLIISKSVIVGCSVSNLCLEK